MCMQSRMKPKLVGKTGGSRIEKTHGERPSGRIMLDCVLMGEAGDVNTIIPHRMRTFLIDEEVFDPTVCSLRHVPIGRKRGGVAVWRRTTVQSPWSVIFPFKYQNKKSNFQMMMIHTPNCFECHQLRSSTRETMKSMYNTGKKPCEVTKPLSRRGAVKHHDALRRRPACSKGP